MSGSEEPSSPSNKKSRFDENNRFESCGITAEIIDPEIVRRYINIDDEDSVADEEEEEVISVPV